MAGPFALGPLANLEDLEVWQVQLAARPSVSLPGSALKSVLACQPYLRQAVLLAVLRKAGGIMSAVGGGVGVPFSTRVYWAAPLSDLSKHGFLTSCVLLLRE